LTLKKNLATDFHRQILRIKAKEKERRQKTKDERIKRYLTTETHGKSQKLRQMIISHKATEITKKTKF
jgi:hypothetical protein